MTVLLLNALICLIKKLEQIILFRQHWSDRRCSRRHLSTWCWRIVGRIFKINLDLHYFKFYAWSETLLMFCIVLFQIRVACERTVLSKYTVQHTDVFRVHVLQVRSRDTSHSFPQRVHFIECWGIRATEITTCFGSFQWSYILPRLHVNFILCHCGQLVYLRAN